MLSGVNTEAWLRETLNQWAASRTRSKLSSLLAFYSAFVGLVLWLSIHAERVIFCEFRCRLNSTIDARRIIYWP